MHLIGFIIRILCYISDLEFRGIKIINVNEALMNAADLLSTLSCGRIRSIIWVLRKFNEPQSQNTRKLYDLYHCCVYSAKLRMMDKGTVRNM